MAEAHVCVENLRVSNVMVKERGRRANFKNPTQSEFRRIRVDDCLITEGPRADWIISKVDVGSVVVELKGKDLDHACKQLSATVVHPDAKAWLEARIALLIVCSRSPKFDSTIAKAKVAARKEGMKLEVVCDGRDFVLEDLL